MKHFRTLAIGAGLTYVAFLLVFCISDAFHAGPPTEMGGLVLGLDPHATALHQVWLLSARSAVALKWAEPETTINALSALFAGAGLCVLLVVFRRVLACAMTRLDLSTFFLQGGDDPDNVLPHTASAHGAMLLIYEEFTARERVALALGTLGAGLVYAFSGPFWSAATRAGPNSFDSLLLLIAIWLTTAFCLRPSLLGACLTSAVAGVGLGESPVFLAAACALAFFYMRTLLRFELPVQRYFLVAVASASVGFALQLGLASLLLSESLDSTIPLTRVLRAITSGHLAALQSVGASPYWMWTLLWAGIPFVIALCLALSGQIEHRFNTIISLMLGTGALGTVLLNFPYTPWFVWRGQGEISIVASLLIVFAAGYFGCRWWLVATVHRPGGGPPQAGDDEPEPADNEGLVRWYVLRLVGAGGLLLALALTLVQPWLNWSEVNPMRTRERALQEGDALLAADASGGSGQADDGVMFDLSVSAEALSVQAMRFLDEGHIDDVERVFLPHLVKAKPALDRDRIELIRGRILLARGGRNLDSARIIFLRLLPRSLLERDRIGDWLLEVGLLKQDWKMVERDCQTILKLSPHHVQANTVLGRALLKRAAPRLAVAQLQHTLTFVTNAPLLTVLGESYLRTGEAEQARSVLEEAISRPDVTGDAYLLLARTLVKQEQPDAVIHLFQNTPPQHQLPELHLLVATVLHARGQTQACREILEPLNASRTKLTLLQSRELDNLLRLTAEAEFQRER